MEGLCSDRARKNGVWLHNHDLQTDSLVNRTDKAPRQESVGRCIVYISSDNE
jgi:hypothetical protein